MFRFACRQLKHRRSRAVALAAGLLVASCSFVVLTATAKTSAITVRGSVESNFHTAYDILVRPSHAATPLERRERLVRPNYLGGIFGGITLAQYRTIKRIEGIDIAAPIANLGYILPQGNIPVPITQLVNNDPAQLYRVHYTWAADNGLSHYPGGDAYVYYNRRDRFVMGKGFTPGGQLIPGRKHPLGVCRGFNASVPRPEGPFSPLSSSYLSCFSARDPEIATQNIAFLQGLPADAIGTANVALFPILVAAIDPDEEARLLGLEKTVTAGRYLREGDAPKLTNGAAAAVRHRVVPAIAATRTYVDDRLKVTVERLSGFDPQNLAEQLASEHGYAFASKLAGRTVAQRSIALQPAYDKLLGGQLFQTAGEISSLSYWSVSQVGYRRLGRDRLAPRTVPNDPEQWKSGYYIDGGNGYAPAPAPNRDLQFRRLEEHERSHFLSKNILNGANLQIVGRYDPTRLPGFSPLSRVPLETYYPPLLEPNDARADRLLHGSPLLPSQNVGGYIQQPPLMLISLSGLKPFLDAGFYTHASARAPIGVIRVRVKGVTGPDALSMARIRAVAIEIHDRTGLTVDITAGSSPHPVAVELPAGNYGRPQLDLREGWSKKGVSTAFLKAVDKKDIALFALILPVCAIFVANGTAAAVRNRRTEFGVLLTVGWQARNIFALVLAELLMIGVIAGAVGVLAALLVVHVFSLSMPLWQMALVLPLAVILALGAGLAPAAIAASRVPLDAVRPAISGAERSGQVRSLMALAMVNLRRVPARTALGAASLFVGVAALTLLIGIERSFQGSLVGTLLGTAISVRVSGFDFASVAIMIVLAALAITDIVYLNLRQRAPELVTLRTCGWGDRHLAAVVVLESIGLAMLGGAGGAAVGVIVGALLNVPVVPLVVAAAMGLAGALVVAVAASLLPVIQLASLSAPAVLTEE